MFAGDILTVDLRLPVGSAPALRRPAVVVNSDEYLISSPPTMQVVPVTSNVLRGYPLDVAVTADGLEVPSVAQCQLLTVISRLQILDDDLGNVGVVALRQIRSVLADLLDI